jgi:hypothetical protein
VFIAAWPRLFGAEKTSVTIQTVPKGALIEVEGKNAGTAADGTLVVRDLEVGRAYPVVARLDGYEPRQAVVQPRAGANAVTLELVALAPTVSLETQPSGASVTIDDAAVGTTPLALTTLPPGKSVLVTFKKQGYQDASAQLDVPGPGKETRLIQPLAVAADLARIKLTSTPSGAQIVQNGQLLAGVTTPAEVLVEGGKLVRFMLTMPGKVPAYIEPFTPGRGTDGLERMATLVDGVTLRVVSNLDGKATVTGAPHCQALPVPAECIVAPGTYAIELAVQAPGATGRLSRRLTVGKAPVEEKFELGIVEAGPNKVLQLPAGKAQRAVFEVGPRRVSVTGLPGFEIEAHPVNVVVKAGATVIAN